MALLFCLVEQILYLLLRSIECFCLKLMKRFITCTYSLSFSVVSISVYFSLTSVIIDIKLIVVVVMAVVVDVGL